MESQSNMGNPPLCSKGCGFYGTVGNKSMCSKCYASYLKEELLSMPTCITPAMVASVEKALDNVSVSASESGGVTKNKCQSCKKRLGPVEMIGLKCRCGGVFCTRHRLPEYHSCSVNYKKIGQELLAKQNPVCKGDKLEWRV
ncbi:hypothetical protein M0R45_037917 [Rubus argutus]|uniref:Uncharacterized protein n=1 Tax=Rubus argutus TaxID=59490 RepID=A0AAW1W415_RUBAR